MRKLSCSVIPVLMALLTGCGTVSTDGSSSNLVPMVATMKGTQAIIKGDPDRAERVREIAADMQRYASMDTFNTVDALIVALNNEIRWERLDPIDTEIVKGLVAELRVRLIERLGEDPVPNDIRLSVELVAGWVLTAASLE